MRGKGLDGPANGFDGGEIPSIRQQEVPSASSPPAPTSKQKLIKNGSKAAARSYPNLNGPPSWYTPNRLILIFCYVLLICYFDIGLFASNGVTGTEREDGTVLHDGLKQAFHLSNTKLGLLPTLFMIGLMIASGILAVLANHFNAFRLVGVGMSVWTLGVILVASSQEFYSLMIGRILVGAGEASVMMLAGPFIDDVAPEQHRTLYLSFLTAFNPVGHALGSMAGNLVKYLSWRYLFAIVAGLGAPVAAFCLFAPPVDLKGAEEQTWDPEHAPQELAQLGKRATIVKALREAWTDVVILHKHPVFVTSVYGFIPVSAVFGGLAFWAPKAAMQIFHVSAARVDLTVGIVMIIAAFTGLLGGGYLLDKLGSTLYRGMLISTFASFAGMVVLTLSFGLVHRINVFFAFIALGLFAMFITGAPLYAISMWSIPKQQRPSSQAVRVIAHHLFGDIPSPAIVGAVQDRVNNWRLTCGVLCLFLIIASVVYGLGTCLAVNAPDYRFEPEDERNGGSPEAPQPKEGTDTD